MQPKISIFSRNKVDLENAQKLFEREGFDVFTFLEASQSNLNKVYKINPDIVFLDIDIVNCFPTLLLNYCKEKDILYMCTP